MHFRLCSLNMLNILICLWRTSNRNFRSVENVVCYMSMFIKCLPYSRMNLYYNFLNKYYDHNDEQIMGYRLSKSMINIERKQYHESEILIWIWIVLASWNNNSIKFRNEYKLKNITPYKTWTKMVWSLFSTEFDRISYIELSRPNTHKFRIYP